MKKIGCAILLLSVTHFVFGQLPKADVSFNSPTASIFRLNNEMPVSKFNGTVGVNIPLYTVKDNRVEIPISLAYNSSGIRPDLHPGPEGLNWTLSAGGAVTRVVKGIPDETNFNVQRYWPNIGGVNRQSYQMPTGYFFNTAKLNTSNWNTLANIRSIASNTSTDYTTGNGYSEAESDEYNFNVAGYSGKFFIAPDGTVRSQSNPNIRMNIYATSINDTTILSYNPRLSSKDYQFVSHSIITGFDVTVEDGTKFVFGYVPGVSDATAWDACEVSINFFQQYYVDLNINSWNITKVVTSQRDTASYYYYSNPYAVANFSKAISYQYTQTYNKSSGFLGWLFGTTGDTYVNFNPNQYRGSLILPSYLAEIVTSNATVQFKYSPSTELTYNYGDIFNSLLYQAGKSFDYYIGQTNGVPNNPAGIPYYAFYDGTSQSNVNISARWWLSSNTAATTYYYDPDNKAVLKYAEKFTFSMLRWYKLDSIQFYTNSNLSIPYKYFRFVYNNNPNERLQLLNIYEGSKRNNELSPYQFTYNKSATLPPYLNYSVDHWGFFNNKNGNVTAYDNTTLTNYFNLRQTDTLYTKAGILDTIKYPTGGYTSFIYEPHSYNWVRVRDETTGNFSVQNQSGYAGGLRIKQMTFYPGNGANTVTNFSYSGGTLNGLPKYYWPTYNGVSNQGRQYSMTTFISESMIPGTTNSAGSYIGYDTVTETMVGRGKSISYFSNFDTNPDANYDSTIDPLKSVYLPYSERKFERGRLLKEEKYDASQNLVQVDSFSYTTSNPTYSGYYLPAVESKQISIPGFYGVNEFGIEATAYRNYMYPYDLVSKTTKVYGAPNISPPVVTSEIMTYGTYPCNQLVRRQATDSKGNIRRSYWKYPQQYMQPNLNYRTGNDILDSLISQHIVNATVEKVDSINYASSAAWAVTGAYLNTYQLLPSNAVSLNKSYKLDISAPISDFQPFAINGNLTSWDSRYSQKMSFEKYDVANNLSQITPADQVKKSYLWDYNNKYPIAEVRNATVDQIAYSSFEADGVGGWTINPGSTIAPVNYGVTGINTFSGALSKTFMVSGNYIVTLWSNPLGNVTVNGTAGTLLNGNGPHGWKLYQWILSNVTSVSISADNIDEVRLYPQGAQMTTYTYDPLIGITSMCDANDKFTYYTYDEFNRLNYIQDQDGNVLKKICYNYAGQPGDCQSYWYNLKKSGSFTKSTCPTGQYGTTVTYVVPAGKYSSAISQADADAKATNDLNTKGQPYADSVGKCFFKNVYMNGNFRRTNCTGCLYGTTVIYTVPAGKYTSFVSQAQADSLATNDLNTNGPTYANSTGSCITPPNAGINGSNTTADNVYMTFQNACTGLSYSFTLAANTNASFGPIPSGTYNVSMSSTNLHTFTVNGYTQSSSTSVNFYNIFIDQSASVSVY